MSARKGGPTPKKHHIKLRVVPEAEGLRRAAIAYTGPGTVVMRGEAAPNLAMDCGACDARLIDGVALSQLRNLVFRCPGCGVFNETVEG